MAKIQLKEQIIIIIIIIINWGDFQTTPGIVKG
jgi:hypothetical protein